ncbi:VOC family protein [Nonomuraea sp. NPDC048826]|uniref:VOC family protein n=1 Tax=Nonomuraea sp. NPDC048826 TaxID=3364347 RepID=UPI003715499B
MTENDREPLVEGITAAIVGVSDFGPHLDLFRDVLGYEVAGEGVVPASVADPLWGSGPADVEVLALAAAGSGTGRIHLVRVPEPLAPAEPPHNLDVGLVGIDMYARDIEAAHASFAASGRVWTTPPTTYGVSVGEREVQVTQGVCPAPDGTVVVFVQPAAVRGTEAWTADPERPYTELTSVVCHVPDPDAEVAFWGPDGLGMGVWYDVVFSAPGFDTVAGLPPGTKMRLAFLAGEKTARIEVTSAATEHRVDRRATQRPARSLGHSGWSVRTRDLAAALDRVRATGGTVTASPVETDDPLHGRALVAAADTPNGIAVTLWQPRG